MERQKDFDKVDKWKKLCSIVRGKNLPEKQQVGFGDASSNH